MKKIVAFLLALVMLLGLVGCTGAKDEFTSGIITENSYENAFLGIGCKLNDDWHTDVEGSEDETVGEEGIVTDFLAATDDATQHISVIVQDMGFVYGAVMDEKSLIESALAGVEQGISEMDGEKVSIKIAEVDFCGATRYAYDCSYERSGMPIFQKQIYLKKGKYLAVITFSTYLENTTDDMVKLFYAI